MISCMHALRLNQRAKLSFREAYHDYENHYYDNETDLMTCHTVRVHSRHHHRHITTAKNDQKRAKITKNNPKNGRFAFWIVLATLSEKIKKV